MNKNSCLLIFWGCLLLFSCTKDEIEILNGTYSDTSIYIVSSQAVDSINIQIGSNTIRIPEHSVFPKYCSFYEHFLIPTIALTNNGTALVSCENRLLFDDLGEIEILLARKEANSNVWRISKVFQYEKEKGRSMNPQFLVDKDNNRIYLFACHLKDNKRYWSDQFSDDIDYVFKYSDDDGITWSEEYSLKNKWNNAIAEETGYFSLFNNKYCVDNIWSNNFGIRNYGVIPSCVKGITLNDNTYIVPCMVVRNSNAYSSLLIHKQDMWYFSRPTPNVGDNECTVYVDNNDRIVLDCRTMNKVRHKYYYDLETDSYTNIMPSLNISDIEVSTEIVKDKNLFYMCFPNSTIGIRENLTFYGSEDGINWKIIYKVYNGNLEGYGYSSIAFDEKQLLICYVAPKGVIVQDLSNCRELIRNEITK